MKKKEAPLALPALGGSSLLAIFAVLCLTVLALLSLSTVLSQKRLSDSALEAVTAYYAADLEAERIFAEVRRGELPEGVEITAEGVRYTCPISRYQTLYVHLQKEEDGWKVLQWQAVADPITIDDSLPVWNGQ